jgi:SAM-dependent methyltransferase
MEGLAFESDAFDVVSGFNSFQFAGDVVQALREARRVCRPGGSVVMLFWGRKEDCDVLGSLLPAALALLPPAPPGPARPALADPGVAQSLMREAGLSGEAIADVDCQLVYADHATAFRAVASAAPFVRAERVAGKQALEAAVLPLLDRFTRPDGTVLLKNRMRYMIATRMRGWGRA